MSDEDEDMGELPVRDGPRVAYGTLAAAVQGSGAGVAAAKQSGNVQVAAEAEHMELSLESAATRERQESLLREFQLRRRARAMAVPTDDKAVRLALRERGEPITLFGEREMERRERLRALLAALDAADGGELPAPADAEVLAEAPAQPELFYTEGSGELLAARGAIAAFSLPRAAARLAAARERAAAGLPPAARAAAPGCAEAVSRLSCELSQLGDERPLSACALSPDGRRLLTAGWSGLAQLWKGLPGRCERAQVLRAHDERVSGVAWHPGVSGDAGGAGGGVDAVAFATAACDKTARLWSAQGTLLQTLRGHGDRLGRCAFHPSGAYLGTACFDATWRLWDVATGTELLCQEGHGRAVYCLAFQRDGALALSGGMDAHGRVWDLRTGRCVLTLAGHVKALLAADWAPGGTLAATGAGDNAARVWDLRAAGRCLATLPAHASLLSAVRFEPRAGGALLTASHDATLKAWSGADWRLLRAMRAGEGRVMDADCGAGAELLATVSYDRTVKIWAAAPGGAPPAENGGGDDDARMGDA